MRHLYFLIMLIASASNTIAQERSLVRKGNELYEQDKFSEAAAVYQKAMQQKPQYVPGMFNLGNALIQQKQYDAARKALDHTVRATKDPQVQSGAQYNTGNTYMSEQQWQQAVDAYKHSLRKNPEDADAKYNLSYALAKLKQQQDKDDKKDEDKKDKQPQKDKEDKKDPQQPKEQDGDEQEKKRPQPQPSKLSEQQADNLLKALQQDEQKVQDKMQQKEANPFRVEKDW